MKEFSRKWRVATTLREHADEAVPRAPGLWPRIEKELLDRRPVAASEPRLRGLRPTGRIAGVFNRGALLGSFAILFLLFGALAIILLGRAMSPAAAEVLRRAHTATDFVPAGKVRHIVTQHFQGDADGLLIWTQDIWLANGASHLLLWKPQPVPAAGAWLGYQPGALLIDEHNIWDIKPSERKVYKASPLAEGAGPGGTDILERRVAAQLPSKVAMMELLQKPGTSIVGTEVLGGRQVLVIAGHVGTIVSGSPLEIATGKASGYSTAEHDYKLWIDSNTYRVVQEQHYMRQNSPNPLTGEVLTSTTRIALDELLDADDKTMSLFRFQLPEGYQLVDRASLPRPTPAPFETGWHTFASVEGRFQILMPRTPEYSSNSNGTEMFGARVGGVAYVIRYRDYPAEVIERDGPERWLDRERDDVLAQSGGRLRNERRLTLGDYPGHEVRSVDPDNRYRITRLYLDGNRLYMLTVITPDESSVPEEVARFLDSFRVLSPAT